MHTCRINQNYKYSQDRVHMYKLAVYQFPDFALTSYFIFMTFPFILPDMGNRIRDLRKVVYWTTVLPLHSYRCVVIFRMDTCCLIT